MKVIKPKSYEELIQVLQSLNVNPREWVVIETKDCFIIEPKLLLHHEDVPVIVIEKLEGLWTLFYNTGMYIANLR